MKIICHASLLTVDDTRLKNLPIFAKVCTLCDHGSLDDAVHMVTQCPALQPRRTVMFDEITEILEGDGRYQIPDVEDIFLIIMGRPAAGTPKEVMVKIWSVLKRGIG